MKCDTTPGQTSCLEVVSCGDKEGDPLLTLMLPLQVTRTVGLRETWYFGLQFLDSRGLISWLDPTKKVSTAFRVHSWLINCGH